MSRAIKTKLQQSDMNMSFAGCGFLAIYHIGVAKCFKNYALHLVLNKLGGASAGAIVACCLLCEATDLDEIANDIKQIAKEARNHVLLGGFCPYFDVQSMIYNSLDRNLPDDAHIRVSGRLHISLTRVYDGKNVIISQFDTKEDLIKALLASSFVPLFSGLLPPRFHGIRYMCGSFSDNLPLFDEDTITVSPFCGENDICPKDNTQQFHYLNISNTSIELSEQNMSRLMQVFYPPTPETLDEICLQGFNDAREFLHHRILLE